MNEVKPPMFQVSSLMNDVRDWGFMIRKDDRMLCDVRITEKGLVIKNTKDFDSYLVEWDVLLRMAALRQVLR